MHPKHASTINSNNQKTARHVERVLEATRPVLGASHACVRALVLLLERARAVVGGDADGHHGGDNHPRSLWRIFCSSVLPDTYASIMDRQRHITVYVEHLLTAMDVSCEGDSEVLLSEARRYFAQCETCLSALRREMSVCKDSSEHHQTHQDLPHAPQCHCRTHASISSAPLPTKRDAVQRRSSSSARNSGGSGGTDSIDSSTDTSSGVTLCNVMQQIAEEYLRGGAASALKLHAHITTDPFVADQARRCSADCALAESRCARGDVVDGLWRMWDMVGCGHDARSAFDAQDMGRIVDVLSSVTRSDCVAAQRRALVRAGAALALLAARAEKQT